MDIALDLLDPLIFDKAYAYLLPDTSLHANGQYDKFDANQTLLSSHDTAILTSQPPIYSSSLSRDSILRQCISILTITQIGATLLYLVFSALSYYLIFDRRLEHHPRFLKNQVRLEIQSSLSAIPWINIMTLPFFLAEVRGYSLLYDRVDEQAWGWTWLIASTALYFASNDFFVYWIHRLEHHPSVYKHIHKPHHKWLVPTPWAALAFHPVDGYVQSLPYHIFVFVCPMQKYLYLVLFVLVQIWTILIHDGDMITGHWLERFINSPAHHTLHHLYFTVNYGLYFTWADDYYGSHRAPQPELDPLHDALKAMRAKGLLDEKEGDTKDGKSKPKGE